MKRKTINGQDFDYYLDGEKFCFDTDVVDVVMPICLGSRHAKLTHLPPQLRIVQNIQLFELENLTHLPKGLEVGGYLDLYGCTSLTALPDDLKVGGKIYREKS